MRAATHRSEFSLFFADMEGIQRGSWFLMKGDRVR